MNLEIRTYNLARNFERVKRQETGEEIITLKEDANKELYDAIRSFHGDMLPNDWIYVTFLNVINKIHERSGVISSIKNIEKYRDEIIGYIVDINYYDLVAWLGQHYSFSSYLDKVLESSNKIEAFGLLQSAQYIAIDEIFEMVLNLLKGKNVK